MNAVTKSVLLGWIFLLVCPAVFADELPALGGEQAKVERSGFNLWVNPGLLSYHFDRDAGFRDLNSGLGVQSFVSDKLSLMAGNFINSDHARSQFVGLTWQPLSWHSIKFGVAAGILDGYPTTNNGGKFLAALPWITIRNERIGVNLTLAPYPNDTHHLSVVSAQVIVRVW